MIRLKKIDLMELLFLLLILSGEHFFYLVNFPISELDFAIIITVLMFILYLSYYKAIGLKKTDRLTKVIVLIVMAMAIVSAIRSQQNYGQSLIMGLRPQRYYLILLSYFPIKNVILNRKDGFKWTINVLVYVGIIAVTLYSIQYLVFPLKFLKVGYDFRFGQVRLRFNEIGTLFSMFYVYYQLIKRPTLQYGLLFVLHLFYYVIVIKGRSGIIVLTLVLVVLLILHNKQKWKAALSIFSLVLALLYVPIPIANQYMEGFREGIDSYQSQTDVRYKGQQFYLQSALENVPSMLFGKGYVNNQNMQAVIISRANDYYIVDNGYYGILYFYGFLGVICNILIYLYILIFSYKLKKNINLEVECGIGIGLYLIFASILVPYMIYYYTYCLLSVQLALIDKMKEFEREN